MSLFLTLITALAGAQLFASMFGAHLARMHFRMMDKHCYVVAKRRQGGAERILIPATQRRNR